MWKRYKTNINYISVALTALLLSIITSHIQAKDKNFLPIFNLFLIGNDTVPSQKQDTVPLVKQPSSDSTSQDSTDETETDTTITGNDTAKIITVDTANFSKDSVDAPIDYKADDSGVFIIPS